MPVFAISFHQPSGDDGADQPSLAADNDRGLRKRQRVSRQPRGHYGLAAIQSLPMRMAIEVSRKAYLRLTLSKDPAGPTLSSSAWHIRLFAAGSANRRSFWMHQRRWKEVTETCAPWRRMIPTNRIRKSCRFCALPPFGRVTKPLLILSQWPDSSRSLVPAGDLLAGTVQGSACARIPHEAVEAVGGSLSCATGGLIQAPERALWVGPSAIKTHALDRSGYDSPRIRRSFSYCYCVGTGGKSIDVHEGQRTCPSDVS